MQNITGTLISRDFSILYRLQWLSIPQTENSLYTKACEAGAANKAIPVGAPQRLARRRADAT